MTWECDIGDGPRIYNWSEQTARKKYKCCECGGSIEAKERYGKAKGLWDGKWDTFRQHLLCAQACMFVRDKLNGYECIAFGGLMEWYGDTKIWLQEHKLHENVKHVRSLLARIFYARPTPRRVK